MATKKATSNHHLWDPIQILHEVPSPQCLQRTRRDLKDIYEQPPPGVFVAAEEQNITKIHALVVGPFDTPYEGGFFHFLIKCPPDYPISPPRVRFMTTDGGRVRFNPNLYACGKVCLSILGTWPGPSWSAAQCIGSLLVSIQSLMNDTPFANEPGFEKRGDSSASRRYNAIIQHETIRVAVCSVVESCFLETCPLPSALREVIFECFLEHYDTYENIARSERDKKHSSIWDVFSLQKCKFDYNGLLKRLQTLKERVKNRNEIATADELTSTGTAPGPSCI